MASSDQVHIAYKKVSPRSENKKSEVAPIILLHGLTASKETWEEVMQPIADQTGREVYALDSRNHGDSGWSDDFSSDVIAEDVLKFVQKMNLSKIILIGHSFGGRAAMKFVEKEPNLVETLIVEDGSPIRPSPSNKDSLREYIQLQRKLIETLSSNIHDNKAAKVFLNNLLSNTEISMKPTSGFENTNGFHLGIKKREDGKFDWKANLERLGRFSGGKSTRTPDLEGVFEKPVLFLYGKKSSFRVEEDEDIIKSLFPNSTLKGIEAGHQIHLGEPEKFVAEVVKFLSNN